MINFARSGFASFRDAFRGLFRAPAFWFRPPGLLSALLTPLSLPVAAVARHRRRRTGWQAPVPVLCVGNLTIGGTGKTTAVLDLVARLQRRGAAVHCLTRGYRGAASRKDRPLRVAPGRHTAADVGDEPLLLASVAPCWVCPDRAAAARAAVAAGATCLIMDDGFQNPGLHKDLSLLLVDGAVGFGNGHVLPAGPLREPLSSGLPAADAVIVTGRDRSGVARRLRGATIPVLTAELRMDPAVNALRGRRLIAFAGLARPEKFFEGLKENGIDPLLCVAFPDHHRFTNAELAHLENLARRYDATLLTTPKDAVRLPAAPASRVEVIGVTLQWSSAARIEALLDRLPNVTGIQTGEDARSTGRHCRE